MRRERREREREREKENGEKDKGDAIYKVSVHIIDTYLPIATPGDHCLHSQPLWIAALFTFPWDL